MNIIDIIHSFFAIIQLRLSVRSSIFDKSVQELDEK